MTDGRETDPALERYRGYLHVLARLQGQISTGTVRSLELQFGVRTKEGTWGQYVQYLSNVIHGNLGAGLSIDSGRRPPLEMAAQRVVLSSHRGKAACKRSSEAASTIPSATELAPAATNSSTSPADATPPIPTIGSSTAPAQAQTHARAIGFRAGPE